MFPMRWLYCRHCWSASSRLENATSSLTAIHSVDGRVEIIAEPDKPVVVVDYAHTEQGLAAVCRSIREHFSGEYVVCVWLWW